MILLRVPTSEYQLFKLRVLEAVPIAKDAAHIYIGFACLLLAVLVLRIPLRSWWALLPGLLATAAMEALDLRDHLADTGRLRWAASLRDVVNTNLIPLVLVLLARRGWLRR